MSKRKNSSTSTESDNLENLSLDKLRAILGYEALLEQKNAKKDFASFLSYCNAQYNTQWFHKLIAQKCQELHEDKIKNLMVFLPPQHGKSEIISRQFPAWVLGKNPNLKIAGCSYSIDLASQFSRAIQRTIDSKEYQAIFPDTYLNGSNVRNDVRGYLRNVDIFETVNHRGFYKAIGVGGGLTGTPVDIAIIDDPVKDAIEANSPTYRERVWDWYNSVLSTRLHNDSHQLFIMTRWHEDDLAGRILRRESQKWEVLSIPAICEVDGDGVDSPRKRGDALWGARHSLERLESMRARSPRYFSALYQQHPSIEGGNIIKKDWFRLISLQSFNELMKTHSAVAHFFIDTAYTESAKNDPTGIVAAACIENTLYVFAARQVRLKFPDLCRWLPQWVHENRYSYASQLHIEPKANGISVVDQLREITELNVVYTPTPRDSKETRLNAISPFVESGRVCVVDADFTESFIDEITGFPAKEHDEYVDTLCYAVNYFFIDDSERGLTASQLLDIL